MEKTKTLTDITIFLIFNILFSLLTGYFAACSILHHALPTSNLIVPLKTLLSRSIYLMNNNSGGWWNNPGADVFIYAVVGFILSFTILLIIYRGSSLSRNIVEKFKSQIHGSAKYANFADLEKVGLTNKKSGVIIAKLPKKNKSIPIINAESKHTLVIGGTGDNKTTGIMIPSLLSIDKEDYLNNKMAFSSAFIFDLKGTIYPKTAGWGEHNGVNVILLDPTNPNYARFNIFNEIDVNAVDFTDKVEAIVQLIMDPGGKKYGEDDFWKSHGRTLLASRIAFELYKNKEKVKNKTNLQKLAYMFKGYDLENDCAYSMEDAFEDMRNCDHPYIKSAGYMYESTEVKTFSGYLSTAQNALNLYVSGTLGEVTSDSTFKLRDLLYRSDLEGNALPPTWFFLSVPFADMLRLEPFVQLFVSAYLSELSKEEDENFIKKYPVRIFADEFTKMGKFDVIGYSLGMLRGFCGIVTLLTQSIQDIVNLYGKENTIMTNCTYTVVLGVQKTDTDTAKLISEQTGTTTVQEIVPTMTIKKGRGFFARDEKSFNYTPHIHKKPLLLPDEITGMPTNECLALFKGANLVKAEKFRYFEDPEYIRRSNYKAPDPIELKTSFIQQNKMLNKDTK